MYSSLLETGFLQNTVEGSGGNIIAGLAGDRDPARFRRMLELTVTPLRPHKTPTVVIEQT